MFFKSYTKLEKWLNEKLAKVLKMQPLTEKNLPQNLLVVGETGTGKTAIIRKWAELNNLNLFDINVSFGWIIPKIQ